MTSVRVGAALLVAACSSRQGTSASNMDVVGDPLGTWNATPEEAYARNLWDLQAYGGRLYLGYGDAIRNSGPTEVIAFDPADGTFTHETVIEEEAILRYRVFGDRLFIPGADAVSSSDDTLYVRDATGWTLIPLPDVVHATDVAVRGDEICVALQDRSNGGAVRCTRDGGRTWKAYPTNSWRAVSLFELGDVLYVSSHESGVRRVDGRPAQFALPGISAPDVLVSQPTRCRDDVVFIAKQIDYAGTAPTIDPLGLFRASLGAAASIEVTRIEVIGTPTDVFAHDNRCYVLTNRATGPASYDVAIYESADNRTWSRRVTFAAETLARSAELVQGYFYVGLGCEAAPCTSASGRLLRGPSL